MRLPSQTDIRNGIFKLNQYWESSDERSESLRASVFQFHKYFYILFPVISTTDLAKTKDVTDITALIVFSLLGLWMKNK